MKYLIKVQEVVMHTSVIAAPAYHVNFSRCIRGSIEDAVRVVQFDLIEQVAIPNDDERAVVRCDKLHVCNRCPSRRMWVQVACLAEMFLL